MANWFECKVKYDKTIETGAIKTVTEPYLVDALSFTEAEARIIEEVTPYVSGEFNVTAVKKTNISEIFYDESDAADRWYKVKTNLITIDEKTAVEKKQAIYSIVQAGEFKDALATYMEGMKDTMADFEIAQIDETALMDVFPAKLGEMDSKKSE